MSLRSEAEQALALCVKALRRMGVSAADIHVGLDAALADFDKDVAQGLCQVGDIQGGQELEQFQVLYQQKPWAFTTPQYLLVTARNRVDAYVEAFSTLTQRGLGVDPNCAFNTDHERMFSDHEQEELLARGMPKYLAGNNTMIRKVRPVPKLKPI